VCTLFWQNKRWPTNCPEVMSTDVPEQWMYCRFTEQKGAEWLGEGARLKNETSNFV